jgi:hypothetical protein
MSLTRAREGQKIPDVLARKVNSRQMNPRRRVASEFKDLLVAQGGRWFHLGRAGSRDVGCDEKQLQQECQSFPRSSAEASTAFEDARAFHNTNPA